MREWFPRPCLLTVQWAEPMEEGKVMALLEMLKVTVGCTYISDLCIEPYNARAKAILRTIKPESYPLDMLSDAVEYLYGEMVCFKTYEGFKIFSNCTDMK